MRTVLCIFSISLVLSACTAAESSASHDANKELNDMLRDTPVVLNFWAASCAFCKHELPWFDELHRTRGHEVQIIGVNMQEPDHVVNAYWSDGGYDFPNILDPDNELRRHYRVSIQPTTIFLDAEGNVVSRKDGPLSEVELQNRVADLLGEDLEPEQPQVSDLPVMQISFVPQNLDHWFTGSVKHTMDLSTILSGGPAKDGIPSIDDPKFISQKEAIFLSDDDVGVLLMLDDVVRFYPHNILNWHEIVNDSIGDTDFFVTYCPLCATGVVYDRNISEGLTTFGVSGMLAESNLLMYDRATESLWNQVTGQAVVGPLTGESLQLIGSFIVPYSIVQDQYPTAQILSTDTGYTREYSRNPYEGYAESDEIIFPTSTINDSLHPKEFVYGIVLNGHAMAYPEADLRERRFINDFVGGMQIHIAFDPKANQVKFMHTDTGDLIDFIPAFWFSWQAQYPGTGIFGIQ